jgi:hypothetical protein
MDMPSTTTRVSVAPESTDKPFWPVTKRPALRSV